LQKNKYSFLLKELAKKKHYQKTKVLRSTPTFYKTFVDQRALAQIGF